MGRTVHRSARTSMDCTQYGGPPGPSTGELLPHSGQPVLTKSELGLLLTIENLHVNYGNYQVAKSQFPTSALLVP